MAQNASRREKFNIHNNLVCLVKSLENSYTAIDFNNECTVTGKIVRVDGFMNIEMQDVIFYNPRGEKAAFKSFFVQARNIRYVHIPEGKTAMELLEEQLGSMKRKLTKAKPTFKINRAKAYHQETVKGLLEQE